MCQASRDRSVVFPVPGWGHWWEWKGRELPRKNSLLSCSWQLLQTTALQEADYMHFVVCGFLKETRYSIGSDKIGNFIDKKCDGVKLKKKREIGCNAVCDGLAGLVTIFIRVFYGPSDWSFLQILSQYNWFPAWGLPLITVTGSPARAHGQLAGLWRPTRPWIHYPAFGKHLAFLNQCLVIVSWLLIGTNFSEILLKMQNSSFTKMHLIISFGKRRSFCPGKKMWVNTVFPMWHAYDIAVFLFAVTNIVFLGALKLPVL